MEEKEANKIQEKEPSTVSRRDFLKSAGVVAGGAAAAGGLAAILTGCQPAAAPVEGEVPAAPAAPAAPPAPAAPVAQVCPPVEGIVEPAFEAEESVFRGSSFVGFGRDKCAVRVDTKNGRIIRIRPTHYAQEGYTEDYMKPWKLEIKGKVLEPPDKYKTLPAPFSIAYKKRVYSPNRIRYPLQRVDWEPGGDPEKVNSQNRGKSKYKRISWDDATTTIASELRRIQEKYGYFAVLAQADGHGEGKTVHGPHGCQTQLLRHMGPDFQSSYTLQLRTSDSWEGWYWGGKHVNGWETTGTAAPQTNVPYEIMNNSEMLIFCGDPETTTWGFFDQSTSPFLFFLTQIGVEQVYITPDLNYAGAVHADKWIPVLPGQDGALYLACCYVWLTEDTYDKEYVATHTLGFDKFAAYVLGNEEGDPDGPKTPEWAAPRCGVPAWTIKGLARNWYQKKTSIEGFMGAGMRVPYGHETCRLQACAEGMQGWGGPGRTRLAVMAANILPGRSAQPSFDRTLVKGEPAPARGLEEFEAALDYFRPHQYISKTQIHNAILDAPISWYGTSSPWWAASDQARPFSYPIPKEQGGTEIHMIWTDTPCWETCWNGGNRFKIALRDPKIEFIIAEHPWMENDVVLADIILPTTTRYEEYDIQAGGGDVWMVDHCVNPIGESKTDYEVSLEVAKKLGDDLVDKYTWGGKSVEDWMKLGWDTRELEKSSGMSFEQFKERGFFANPYLSPIEDIVAAAPGGRGFYEDPVANPLKTPSGLLEYESSFMVENFPDDKERPPVPHYMPEGETHQDNHLGERAQKYPLLVISNHGRWKMHAELDDVSWFRELPTGKVKGVDGYMYEPLWLHPIDAEKRGIKTGDIVGMFNERGMVLGGAIVTERLIPGAAYQDHGARVDSIIDDPDIPQSEYIDRGGANNLICPEKPLSKNANGQASSGFLVEVKKVNILELMEKYPEAFNKPYDPASGLLFSSWVEGGEL